MLCSSKPAVGCSVGFGGPYDMEKDGSEYGKESSKDIGNDESSFASYDVSSYDMEKDGWGFGGSYDSEKLASTATNVGYKVGASLKMPEVASVVG